MKNLTHLLITALLTALLVACGGVGEDATPRGLTGAAEDRADALSSGSDSANAGDILLLLIAGVQADEECVVAPDDIVDTGADSPGSTGSGPLTPDVDPGSISGTSPDPAPEIGPDKDSDCEEGYSEWQGHCVKDEVLAALRWYDWSPDPAPEEPEDDDS